MVIPFCSSSIYNLIDNYLPKEIAEELTQEEKALFIQKWQLYIGPQKEIGYLDAIISDKNSDQDTISDAQDQKLALVAAMEKEVTIEGLVKAKGFKDCVVTIQKGTVNVVVDNDEELTQEQAAQILERCV